MNRIWPLLALTAVLLMGCGKNDDSVGKDAKKSLAPAVVSTATPTTVAAGLPLARIHWLGKRQIIADPSSASLAGVWRLPETVALEDQTLDKLSLAPWHLLDANTNVQTLITNYAPLVKGPSALLRPMLEDLLNQEFYFEVRRPASNGPVQLGLAVRLDEPRSALWKTNLAAVLESLTGGKTAPAATGGWSIPLPAWGATPPASCELSRADEWTLVGIGQGTNAVISDFQKTIERAHQPFGGAPTNSILDLNVKPAQIMAALGQDCPLFAEIAQLSFLVFGNGENILTDGKLQLTKPLPFEVESWIIPTNLVPNHLASFTAIQGFKPWLISLPFWKDLQIEAPPSQFYLWSQQGVPFLTTCAVLLPGASNALQNLSLRLPELANPWLASNKLGVLERVTNSAGIHWNGLLIVRPALEYTNASGADFVVCRLSIEPPIHDVPPPELMQQIAGKTDLVAYDWEATGTRLVSLLYLGQLSRLMSHNAQLMPDSLGLKWLLAAQSLLGNSATSLSRSGPSELVWHRRSTCGLTALEVQLLADWLESPTFPRGIHTFSSPYSVLTAPRRARTNAPSATPKR